MTTHEFALLFTACDCPNCGTEGPAGIPCAGCGRSAESDPHVDRRREIVGRAMGRLDEDLKQVGQELDFNDGLLQQLGRWLHPFMDLCAEAALEHNVAHELDAKIDLLRQWEADLRTTSARRPYLWYWRFASDVVGQLQTIARTYLKSLMSPSPQDAERLGGEAQEAIDDAASIGTRANSLLDRWNTILDAGDDDDPMAVLIAIAEADSREREHLDVLTSDERANALYKRVTGKEDCPPLLRLGLRLTEIQTEFLVDPDRFWQCAALTYRRLETSSRKGQEALAQVALESSWTSDLQDVQDEMFEIGREIRALASQFDSPKVVARALVRVGHQLAERCAPTLLATVLAAYRGRRYEELRDKDVGTLLSEAEDVDLKSLLFGIDRALRHGDAHKLFQLSSDGVVFTAQKREYDELTWAELLDRVLGGWESVLALLTGILCSLESVGGDIDAVDPLGQLDVPLESKLKFILALLGWTDIRIQRGADDVEIRALAKEMPRRLQFLFFLAPCLPRTIHLTVTVDSGEAVHSWSGPVEVLAPFIGTSGTDEDKQAAILQMLVTWKEDEAPLITQTQLRKLAATYVLQWTTAKLPLESRIRNVGLIGHVAAMAEDAELAEAVQLILRGLRLIGAGTKQPRGWQRSINKLKGWAATAVSPPKILD
jgi:hypothetical protein